jgi:type II secretory pathway component GspD/PulD (secretin)
VKGAEPLEFQATSVGMMLEVTPTLLPGDLVDVDVNPIVTEYLGMKDLDTDKAVSPLNLRPRAGLQPLLPAAMPQPKKGQRLKPVFSRRQTSVSATIPMGHILILTNLVEREKTKPFKGKDPEFRLMVVIRVQPEGRESDPASAVANDKLFERPGRE